MSSLIYLLLTGKVPTEEQLPIIEDVLQSVREELEDRIAEYGHSWRVSEYEKTVLLVAASQLLMDQGLTYRPMMELDTQYYNLQEDLEN